MNFEFELQPGKLMSIPKTEPTPIHVNFFKAFQIDDMRLEFGAPTLEELDHMIAEAEKKNQWLKPDLEVKSTEPPA